MSISCPSISCPAFSVNPFLNGKSALLKSFRITAMLIATKCKKIISNTRAKSRPISLPAYFYGILD